MRLTGAGLGIAAISLLNGCMMVGGWGHTAAVGPHAAGHMASAQQVASSQRAEASSDGLTLTLSVAAPAGDTEMAISAWLQPDTGGDAPDGEIWLALRAPDGSVDRLRMREPRSPGDDTYRADYAPATSGTYVVTAEARVGIGSDPRTVSVTTEVVAGDDSWHDQHDWMTPWAVVGGVGMLVLMAVMMAGH